MISVSKLRRTHSRRNMPNRCPLFWLHFKRAKAPALIRKYRIQSDFRYSAHAKQRPTYLPNLMQCINTSEKTDVWWHNFYLKSIKCNANQIWNWHWKLEGWTKYTVFSVFSIYSVWMWMCCVHYVLRNMNNNNNWSVQLHVYECCGVVESRKCSNAYEWILCLRVSE